MNQSGTAPGAATPVRPGGPIADPEKRLLISRIGSAFVMAIGAVVLVGWWLEAEFLVSPIGLPQMKANAALGMIAAGGSLLSLQPGSRGARRMAGRGLAWFVVLLGAATLFEYIAEADLGIDELLVDDEFTVATPSPGRMGANTAFCMVLAGAGLLLIDVKRGHPSQICAAGIGLIALVTLLGFAYDFLPLTRLGDRAELTPMAFNTAVAFLAFAVALCCAQLSGGVWTTLASDGPGGTLARRPLVVVAILTVILGFLSLEGRRRGLYGTEADVALLVAAVLVLVAATVAITARQLDRSDASLRASEARFRRLVEGTHAIVIEADAEGRITFVNEAAKRVLGYATPLGGTPEAFLASGELEASRDRMMRLARGEELDLYRVETKRVDGSPVVLLVSSKASFDVEGHFAGVTATATDITDLDLTHRELQRTSEALRASDQDRRHLLAQLIRAEELERSRIASEIHDGSIQTLSAGRLRLGAIADELDEPERREMLREVDHTLLRAAQELRELVFDLRPPSLDESGLPSALREYLDQLHAIHGIEIDLEVLDTPELPPEIAGTAYRIAREAVSNAQKHSGADRIDVVVATSGRGLVVRVRDDGRGFDPDAELTGAHFGLSLMKERAEATGGSLRIDSSSDRGTRIECEIPLNGHAPPGASGPA